MVDANWHTLSDLADKFERPYYHVEYAVKVHKIEPAGRIGRTRVWSRDDLPRIQAALASTAENATHRKREITDQPATIADAQEGSGE